MSEQKLKTLRVEVPMPADLVEDAIIETARVHRSFDANGRAGVPKGILIMDEDGNTYDFGTGLSLYVYFEIAVDVDELEESEA